MARPNEYERQRSRVSGALFVSGAFLVAAAMTIAPDAHPRKLPLVAICVVAASVGALIIAVGERVVVPLAALQAASIGGSAVVAAVILLAEPSFAPVHSVFYLYVAIYAAYYFSARAAAVQVVVAAAVGAAALALAGAPNWPADWLTMFGAVVFASLVVGRAGYAAREAYLAQEAALDQMRHVAQMKDTFLQAVSHELRTPLAIIDGIAQTLAARLDDLDPDQVKLLLDRQQAQSRRLARLLGDLLDVDRLERGAVEPRPTPVDVGRLVAQTIEQLDPVDHPIAVRSDAAIVITSDPAWLERIVENLASNSVRHTPAGTTITVDVARTDDGGAAIVVSDRGPGVPDAMKDAVFEPFNRGRGDSPGIGIGLALVSSLTAALGGRVSVTDAPGGGAAFHVTVPDLAPADPAVVEEVVRPAPAV